MRLLVFLFLVFPLVAVAQLSTKSKKAIELYTEADNYRVRRQYSQAVQLLNAAIEKDKKFVEAYHRLGLVYFNMRSFARATEQFEKGLELAEDLRKQKMFWFDLGETYLLQGEYEKAIKVLDAFLKAETQSRPRIDRARQNYRTAEYAIKNKNNTSGYVLKPMSDTINRFPMQYFPVLTADQQTLIFTRRTGFTDQHDEDLVFSTRDKNGRWSAPSSLASSINSNMNEGTCSISADGRKLIFTSCAGRDSYGSCDLYETTKVGNEWTPAKNLGPLVNSPAWESQPSLSADGRTLYFVSDRKSGMGQRDIWYSTLDENGQWTKAVNLGKTINTEFDEMSPFIHVNNKTLFFATNALEGFGGYDIFFTERDSLGGWTKPKNMGSPVNNHDDQFSLFITADGKKGYYSHEETRDDGRSYSKIYEMTIPEEGWVKYRSNYVKGVVREKATGTPLSAKIELVDLNANKVESLVKSDSLNGAYLMVLTQGAEYALYVTKPGFLFKSVNFNYSEVKDFEPITLDVELERVRQGTSVVLNNIFFDVDKYELKGKSGAELNKVIRFLSENPSIKIEIGGHTDDTGKEDYNKELSRKRAQAVHDYLTSHGVSASRLTSKGFGSSQPVGDNSTEQGRQLNRRIEFRVLSSR